MVERLPTGGLHPIQICFFQLHFQCALDNFYSFGNGERGLFAQAMNKALKCVEIALYRWTAGALLRFRSMRPARPLPWCRQLAFQQTLNKIK